MCEVLPAVRESCEVMEKEVARLDQLNKDLKATCQQLQATVDDLSRCSITCHLTLCSLHPCMWPTLTVGYFVGTSFCFLTWADSQAKLERHCVCAVTRAAGDRKYT